MAAKKVRIDLVKNTGRNIMKKKKDNIWVGKQDLKISSDFANDVVNEFKEVPTEANQSKPKSVSSRRDFLKLLGFGIGAVALAGCETPVKKAIPYVIKPEEIVPGVPTFYASSYVKGGDYCPIVVKTREGRPIKIEGNQLSKITSGGTSARVQADVLNLYNNNRLRQPKIRENDKFVDADWNDFDAVIKSRLHSDANIRLVTNTILSPTTKRVLQDFKAKYPKTKVVTYDPVSSAAQLIANEKCFGRKEIPNYRFEEADVIVGFNADFLGTWISPIEYSHKYSQKRRIKDFKNPKISKHIQVESYISLTGSNADNRILVKPSEQSAAIAYLYNRLAAHTGEKRIEDIPLDDKIGKQLSKAAEELLTAKGKSLVVCGNNNVGEQILVNKINDILGNLGKTIDFTEASYQRQGDERAMFELIKDMEAGVVDAVIFFEANPLYDFPGKKAMSKALDNVKTKIAISYSLDDTAVKCDFIASVSHTLESWGDAMPKRGHYSLIQPTIGTIFNTRQKELNLLSWAGVLDEQAEQPYYHYLKNNWKEIFPVGAFDVMWRKALKDGVFTKKVSPVSVQFKGDIVEAEKYLTKDVEKGPEISFFETVNQGNGQFAENPWLQEMPNPVDRTTWGNHLQVPVKFDGDNDYISFNNLEDGDKVQIKVGDETKEVVTVVAFGQMQDTVALPLGYGRRYAGMVGSNIGVDVNDVLPIKDGLIQYFMTGISVGNKIGADKEFAQVQYHHTIGLTDKDKKTGKVKNVDEAAFPDDFWKNALGVEGFQGFLTDRSVVYMSNLENLKENIHKLKEKRKEAQHLNEQQIYEGYDEVYERGHHWGMHIDTNQCVGCGACTIACMAENNVPIVGKKEVHRHHEMSWLRIDRYFYGDVENPNTVYQPMMCQQCDNAPCENVCPVNATSNSSEGLNQMVYSRCIGTRYCANNCPYKVRRFNWLDYTTADTFRNNEPTLHGGDEMHTLGDDKLQFASSPLVRMVLNPDVTVRSRGVIEKCSFCTQRLQAGKLQAKKEGRKLREEDVVPACQAACPTGAIVFGDKNDKDSELVKRERSPLSYIVLEETNARSSVSYSMNVKNKE